MKTMKDVFAITQTKVGLMFALVVPVLFLVVWMTGYQGATERLDQLRVAVVADQGSADFYQQFKAESPFTVSQVNSTEAGLKQLDQGDVEMVLVADLTNEQHLTFHVNQANAEFANGILKARSGTNRQSTEWRRPVHIRYHHRTSRVRFLDVDVTDHPWLRHLHRCHDDGDSV